MQIFRDTEAMRAWSRRQHAAGRRIALVPTMGSLHRGHDALVEAAKQHADAVVVSIYVNPTQFGDQGDFRTYPRTFEADRARLEELGVDAVFAPERMYPSQGPPHATWVQVDGLTRHLCGQSRPDHFRGVTTIVAKFFHIVSPDVAVFGDKDHQQRVVIARMVRDLDFGVAIVGVPTVRDADGLALSSRNGRLSPEERARALAIPAALDWARGAVAAGTVDAGAIGAAIRERLEATGLTVDYVEIVDASTLDPLERLTGPAVLAIAAHAGAVRLIDNVTLAT